MKTLSIKPWKKIVSIALALSMLVGILPAGLMAPKMVQAEGSVCEIIGGATYDTLQDAIDAVPDGLGTTTTIQLLQDVTENGIGIDDKDIIIDGAGYKLSVENADYRIDIGMNAASNVTFNDIGTFYVGNGLYTDNSSNVTINCDIIADDACIYLRNSSTATVNGNITSTDGDAVYTTANSNITVTGNITASNGCGVYAENANAEVFGDITAGDVGVAVLNSNVKVTGNVTTTGDNAVSANNGNLEIIGDIRGGYGVNATNHSNVKVTGNITAVVQGVYAVNNSTVEVIGDVTASDDYAIIANSNAQVTIDGVITSSSGYIYINNTDYTISNYTTPTTKAGYATYTDDDSTVWVSVPKFQFDVAVAAGDLGFYIPVSGGNGGKAYNWNIDWGDSNTQTFSGTGALASAGLLHTYSTAGTYLITITPNGSTDAWLAAFGFLNGYGNGVVNGQANKNKVTCVYGPLEPNMTRTAAQISSGTAPDYEWASTFYGCSNLTLSDDFNFVGWDGINNVGNFFASFMFTFCTSLTALPPSFNLPPNITSVGTYFANNMFSYCTSLTALPPSFNLPPNITSVGNYFAISMFDHCTSLTALPASFNFPQNITTAGDYFAAYMFRNCTSLTTLQANFNLLANITSVGDYFASGMFSYCTSLTALPAGFNLPPNIMGVGNNFAGQMFYNCTSLTALPSSFNLPPNITGVGNYFAMNMFSYCTSLTTLPSSFNLPRNITSVGTYFTVNMFSYCTSLITLPPSFNFPQNITTAGSNFAYQTFLECCSLKTLPEGFKFTNFATFHTLPSNAYYQTFFTHSAKYRKNITAEQIWNGNPIPASNLQTFDCYYNLNSYFSNSDYSFTYYDQQAQMWKTLNSDDDAEPIRPYYYDYTDENGDECDTYYYYNAAENVWYYADGTTICNDFDATSNIFPSFADYNTIDTNLGGLATKETGFAANPLDASRLAVTPVDSNATGAGSYWTSTDAQNGTLYWQFDTPNATLNDANANGHITTQYYGGLYSIAEKSEVPKFQFEVTVAAGDLNFYIPTDGSGLGKPYSWDIDWGDGIIGTYNNVGSPAQPRLGLTHNYSSAGKYVITITPHGSTDAWLSAFGFYNGITTGPAANTQANKNKVTCVYGPIEPNMTRTAAQISSGTAPDYEWANTFYGCTNLTLSDDFNFVGWDSITNVGNYFATNMFYNCTSLTALPSNFNLPQNITTVGNYFASYMFIYCKSLTTLPSSFNLPLNITSVGDYFAQSMFSSCTSLTALPSSFNLPLNITSVGDYFAQSMFATCTSLTALPSRFNLPQDITTVGNYFAGSMFSICKSLTTLPSSFNLPLNITSVGNCFAYGMFSSCTSLTALPSSFNLPLNITSVGDYFAQSMFATCTSLTALPSGFNLPQGITTVGDSFAGGMFVSCTSLTALPSGFNLPQGITTVSNYFGGSMFSSCTSLTALPSGFNLPQGITTVGDNFGNYMFSGCTSLTALPSNFNLPQDITTVGDYFGNYMFYNCASLKTLPADFKFTKFSTLPNDAYVGTFLAYNAKYRKNLTAAEIWNGNPLPTNNIGTFNCYYSPDLFYDYVDDDDHYYYHYDEESGQWYTSDDGDNWQSSWMSLSETNAFPSFADYNTLDAKLGGNVQKRTGYAANPQDGSYLAVTPVDSNATGAGSYWTSTDAQNGTLYWQFDTPNATLNDANANGHITTQYYGGLYNLTGKFQIEKTLSAASIENEEFVFKIDYLGDSDQSPVQKTFYAVLTVPAGSTDTTQDIVINDFGYYKVTELPSNWRYSSVGDETTTFQVLSSDQTIQTKNFENEKTKLDGLSAKDSVINNMVGN